MRTNQSPPIVELQCGRVQLRQYVRADAPGIVARSKDAETNKWTGIPQDISIESAQAWIDEVTEGSSSNRLCWAVDLDGQYAGHVGLRPDGDGGHVHFDTLPWARGQRVASVAANLVSRWALSELNWSAVIWRAHTDNSASAKTAWRAGFGRPILVPFLLEQDGHLVHAWYATMTSDMPDRRAVEMWSQYLPHATSVP